MKWNRKELKERGYEALQLNYWKSCFVGVLMLVLSIGTFYTAFTDFISELPTAIDDMYHALTHGDHKLNMQFVALFVTLTFGILLLNAIAKVILNVFIKNPVEVGSSLFMLNNFNDERKGMVSDIVYAFDHDYLFHVKTTFIVAVQCYLWAILLIVPGIIKKYEYRMVPYILSERSNLTPKEVMNLSKEMMNGHKWNAFLLDMSFLLWHIMGVFSLGILEVFYVKPYEMSTDAALYLILKQVEES